jgi:predicted methyltransferase
MTEMKRRLLALTVALPALALAACGGDDEADVAATDMPAAEQMEPQGDDTAMDADDMDADEMGMDDMSDDDMSADMDDAGMEAMPSIAAALDSADRPVEDRDRDATRMPRETLEFAGLEPGMTVLELEAGSGYFTEILSRAVGPDGRVIMQNPAAFDAFLGDRVTTRLADDRLANVEVSKTNFDDLSPADGSVDLVTWIQGPHELWYTLEGVDTLGDPGTSFEEIARVLKPGGALLVVDHMAAEGTGPEVGGDLHRILPEHITELAEMAGLTLEDSADFLENPEDPLDNNVFDESIRGETSQFVILYRK